MSFLICAISASKKNETRKHKSKKSERMHPCVVPHQNGQKNSVSPLRRRDKYKKGPLNDELKGASGVKQYISCQQMKPSVFWRNQLVFQSFNQTHLNLRSLSSLGWTPQW
jgi:predicted amidophosphoribosyltransferase